MKRFAGFVLIAAIAAAVQHREELSRWGSDALRSFRAGVSGGPTVVKCITKDGVSYFNSLPANVVCEKTETIHLKSRTMTSGSVSRPAPSKFTCDGRRYCSQMTSCEEARFFLAHCPNTRMDGDHDGVPCERQWCG